VPLRRYSFVQAQAPVSLAYAFCLGVGGRLTAAASPLPKTIWLPQS
jgi:hypothetical protein